MKENGSRNEAALGIRVPLVGRDVLVVGVGEQAPMLVQRLVHGGASVEWRVPAGRSPAEMPEGARVVEGAFTGAWLAGRTLVVAASDSPLANRWVAARAERDGVACLNTAEGEEVRLIETLTLNGGDVALDVTPPARGAAKGAVYLIGAGPGDPELITVRALRRLRSADVVFHDRLVPPEIMALVPPEAERVFVGKSRDRHPVPQERINELLVEHARAGRRVARLKGGDPFIFGRGGEEIDSLMREGIEFEVIPGITAASGCAAYAGIPLTHRDYAQSVVFATGHRKVDGDFVVDFSGLVRPGQTIVFYMGLAALPKLAAGLEAEGLSPSVPAALVQQGTTERQRVITGPLRDLPALAAEAGFEAPTLVIVGEVVRLRERLSWFTSEAERAEEWVAGPGTAERFG